MPNASRDGRQSAPNGLGLRRDMVALRQRHRTARGRLAEHSVSKCSTRVLCPSRQPVARRLFVQAKCSRNNSATPSSRPPSPTTAQGRVALVAICRWTRLIEFRLTGGTLRPKSLGTSWNGSQRAEAELAQRRLRKRHPLEIAHQRPASWRQPTREWSGEGRVRIDLVPALSKRAQF